MNGTRDIPELTDEQVRRMGRVIMQEVEDDLRTRRRRGRLVLSAAAAVVVVGIGSAVIGNLPDHGSAGDSGGSSATSARDAGGVRYQSGGDSAAPEIAEPGDVGAADADCPGCATSDREVITTGFVVLTVTKPQEAAEKISVLVEKEGGRVDQRSESAADGDKTSRASLTIRVPSGKVNSIIAGLDAFGSVDDVSIDNTDVTAQGRDLDARIDALKISVDRLEEFMRTAASSEALLKAESALTKRQSDLESLLAERKGLSDQVALSTFQVELHAKKAPESVSSGGFAGGFVDGWNGLVSAVNGIVVAFGFLLPWLVVAAVLGAAALWLRHRRTA